MTTIYAPETLARIADIQDASGVRADVDRSFELPTALYGLTVAAYLGFLAVMSVGLATRELIVPIGICVAYIVMAFGTPMMWARMKPETNRARAIGWSAFKRLGLETYTGHVAARDAMVQVLILPGVVLAWGVTIVAIAALV